jgi:enoyl-CoA hydratase
MPIRYELRDHVVTITIDRYERRNAIDPDHAEQLIGCWERFRDDPEAWVAIITGVRNVFCSGGDLKDMGAIASELAATGNSATRDRISNFGKGGFTLKGLDIFKPIIAAVNGYCMAGGMELLGGADLRIASSDAIFSVTEPRRGLFAGGGTTARLPRQLSWPAAMEFLLVAGNVSAERALRLGLLNEVVAPEDLIATANRWAREIVKNAPLAVQATKKSAMLGFRAATLEDAFRIEDACSVEVFATEDAQEGVAAFFERREPVWKGR